MPRKQHIKGTCPGWRPGSSWNGMCFVCWKNQNPDTLLTGRKLPSIASQAVSFTRSLVRHVRAGRPKPPPEEIERRQSICRSCPEWVNGRCSKCGCYTKAKSAWALEKCPIGRWELPIVEDDKPEDDPVPITDEPPLVASSVPRCDILRRFDHRNLFPNLYGMRFNPSIAPFRDGYAFVYRTGWKGSDIFICQMDKSFQPIGPAKKLNLLHRHARYGREDPRLFYFREQLHIAYAGVVAGGGRRVHTNILYARLSDRLTVERVFYPHYQRRNLWEKNWQFFEHDDQLYCVYSISSHKILRIDDDKATEAYDTWTSAPWSGGEPRGGASPVLIGDEWYCFFHSRVNRPEIGRVYNTGVYTFRNEPPFSIQRFTPTPIQEADHTNKPGDQYAAVVFAGGAVFHNNQWVIANGIHDRWSELHAFDAIEIDKRLVHVAMPQWCDARAFQKIVTENEYRLPDYFGAGDPVIDVTGTNDGAFELAAWNRGSRRIVCYQTTVPLSGVQSFINERIRPAFSRNGEIESGPTLDDVIGRYDRVAWVKMDIYGDVSVLADCSILDRVNGISIKWHGEIDPIVKILDRWKFNIRIFRQEVGAGIIVGDRR